MKTTIMNGQLCLVDTKEAGSNEKLFKSILKERLECYGVNNLMDEEILSIFTGISIDVLRKAIDNFGILDVVKYANSLQVTKTQKRKLELINMLYKRMLTASYKEKPVLNSSTLAGEYAKSLFIGKAYEAFYVLCLDSQNRLNYAALVHEGTINESPVYPRVIVETALKYRANSVILSHNHPGGSQTPSQADLDVTKKIRHALESISIKVMDHIVVAENKYTSFAERGLL